MRLLSSRSDEALKLTELRSLLARDHQAGRLCSWDRNADLSDPQSPALHQSATSFRRCDAGGKTLLTAPPGTQGAQTPHGPLKQVPRRRARHSNTFSTFTTAHCCRGRGAGGLLMAQDPSAVAQRFQGAHPGRQHTPRAISARLCPRLGFFLRCTPRATGTGIEVSPESCHASPQGRCGKHHQKAQQAMHQFVFPLESKGLGRGYESG